MKRIYGSNKTILIALLLALMLAFLPMPAVPATAKSAAAPQSLDGAVSDLRDLFNRFGEVDNPLGLSNNDVYRVLTDDEVNNTRQNSETSPTLKDLEDWSFMTTDPCTLWVSSHNWVSLNTVVDSLYKIPLGKLNTNIALSDKPFCDSCSTSLQLQMVNNEHAIKQLSIFADSHSITLTNESGELLSVSSRAIAQQAVDDLHFAINACH